MEKPASRPELATNRLPHTRPQPYKRCVALTPRKNSDRSFCLTHEFRQQRLESRIVAQRIEPLVSLKGAGVAAQLNAAFVVGFLENAKSFLFFSQRKVNQRERITLDELPMGKFR